jgi:hypothetical protein
MVQCKFAAKKGKHAVDQRSIEPEKKSKNGSDRRRQNDIPRPLRPTAPGFRLGERG